MASRILARMAANLAGHQAAEALISVYLLACGMAWLANGDGMAGVSSYRIMLRVMGDAGWGGLWAALGLAWLISSHQHWRIRRLAAVLAAGVLIWCGTTFVLSNPATALGWGLLVLGGGAGLQATRPKP